MSTVNRLIGMAAAATIVLIVSLQPAFATDTLEWRFKVLLDDKPIGFHNYDVAVDGSERRVEMDAKFDVKFLFINAYSYQHRNAETWEAGCLTDIDAFTNANGKKSNVSGSLEQDAFVLQTNGERERLGECVRSFAYWDADLLKAERLLNTQTGELESIDIGPAQAATVDVDGQAVAALRHDIDVQGKTISVWYAKDGARWLALEAPAKGDRTLRYAPISVPSASRYHQVVNAAANAATGTDASVTSGFASVSGD